jgi:hypothetical protein
MPQAHLPAADTGLPITREQVEAQIESLIDLLDTLDGDRDAEPSLGWQTGNQSPEHHSQAAIDFCGDANSGDDREEEDEREPHEDSEPSLGWTSQVNQTSPGWRANHLGMTDLEEGVGAVRKKRPASRTGGKVCKGCEILL